MFRLGLLTLALSTAALAQTIPGTFTAAAPQQNSVRPLVSTPTVTLGNGLSPATVTMQQTVFNNEPSGNSASAVLPQSEGMNGVEIGSAPSDYAPVDPLSSSFGAAPSLADVARQYSKGRIEVHKTYTNEDIDRLTSQGPTTGIIYARLANGQPIADRNQNGFSPMSGIANMPDVNPNPDNTELANDKQQANPADQNPAGDAQQNATASNQDQGQPAQAQPTTPADAQNTQQPASQGQQQMPASDNPR